MGISITQNRIYALMMSNFGVLFRGAANWMYVNSRNHTLLAQDEIRFSRTGKNVFAGEVKIQFVGPGNPKNRLGLDQFRCGAVSDQHELIRH